MKRYGTVHADPMSGPERTLGARLRLMWSKPAAPPRQLTPEQWHYQQQQRAVKQGVLNAFGTVMLWSLVAGCVMVGFLMLLAGGL